MLTKKHVQQGEQQSSPGAGEELWTRRRAGAGAGAGCGSL